MADAEAARSISTADGFGRVVKAKGRAGAAALVALNAWFSEAALTGTIRLRTDGEPAIRAVAQAAALRRAPAETHLETTPVGSSDSLGACERFSETGGPSAHLALSS